MTIASSSRFQNPAAAELAPKLYSWGARALYIGPALGLSPHRNAVAVVALALDDSFDVALNPCNATEGYRSCRGVLIPPNTLHHLANTSGAMAFLYIDAHSRELRRLMSLSASSDSRAGFDLDIETSLIDTLRRLASDSISWSDAQSKLDEVLSGVSPRPLDSRVQRAIDLIRGEPSARISLADLARQMRISESRFLHLFKSETGVPLRRYKIWVAMRAAIGAIARGESLTNAALEAGFSSASHFSAAFHEMFGMTPSRFAHGGLQFASAKPGPNRERAKP